MISFKTDNDQEIQITNEQSQLNENLETYEDQFDHSKDSSGDTSENKISDILTETANLNEEYDTNNIENDKTDRESNKESQNFNR